MRFEIIPGMGVLAVLLLVISGCGADEVRNPVEPIPAPLVENLLLSDSDGGAGSFSDPLPPPPETP